MNILMNLSNDPVPNIRIVVVKIINEIYPNLPNKNAIKSAL